MRRFLLIASLVLLSITACRTRADEIATSVAATVRATLVAAATDTAQPTQQGRATRTPAATSEPATATRAATATATRPSGPPTRTPSPTPPAAEASATPRVRGEATPPVDNGGEDPTNNNGGNGDGNQNGDGGIAEVTPGLPATATARGNLLVNGDFYGAFSGWNMENGFWRIHDIAGSECAARNPDWPLYMAEMDRDNCTSCNVWPVGGEDRLWQDVSAPAHARVYLTLTEAHHMATGRAQITLYGSTDGTNWETVWQRAEPDALYGAGHKCETPPSFTYEINASYPYYRVELSGWIAEEADGWLIGPIWLAVE